MHGNVSNGVWTTTSRISTVRSRRRTSSRRDRSCSPVPRNTPTWPEAGSWDDDADRLRSARLASNLEWSVQDPQRPQSIWWHTDATFVGFRVVRALDEQEDLRGVKSLWLRKRGRSNSSLEILVCQLRPVRGSFVRPWTGSRVSLIPSS